MGTPPPPQNRMLKKVRQLLGNCVHDPKGVSQKVDFMFNECLIEDVCTLFITRKILQVDNPIIY